MEKSKKILIVDDDELLRKNYAELFRTSGFEVVEASDGVEGLDKATSEEGIDVIFTGIIMPRMDGFQMIEALKKNASTSNIPVFMNSHLGKEDDRKKAMELGAKDFIIKGMIPLNEIVKKISDQFNENKSYLLKIDPFELDGQRIIQDLKLPDDFTCDNCGTNLAVKLDLGDKGKSSAQLICPNCKKIFLG